MFSGYVDLTVEGKCLRESRESSGDISLGNEEIPGVVVLRFPQYVRALGDLDSREFKVTWRTASNDFCSDKKSFELFWVIW